jgi:polar amino acid transport system substrate-binding protein
MKKWWWIAGLAAVLGLAVWFWLNRSDPLVMGTHAHFPPFELIEPGAQGDAIVGFVVDMPFDELIPALEAGTVDMVLVAMTITADRAERVDFSQPYYKATQVVLIREGEEPPASLEDLDSRLIAAQAGTTSEALAQEWAGLGNVRSTRSAKAAIVDLLNSQADAVLMDEQPATAFRNIFPEAQIVRLPFPDEFYGVAVRKGNARLLDLVNATLEDVRTDGRYDWFIDRWLLQAD